MVRGRGKTLGEEGKEKGDHMSRGVRQNKQTEGRSQGKKRRKDQDSGDFTSSQTLFSILRTIRVSITRIPT